MHIVGRGKDLIISGGFNVYPKEVEAKVDLLPGIVESAVVDPTPISARASRRSSAGKTAPARDRRYPGLDDRLARCKQPKRVIFVEELPRNTTGKVQKNILRQTYA